jgi:hypothetical protein
MNAIFNKLEEAGYRLISLEPVTLWKLGSSRVGLYAQRLATFRCLVTNSEEKRVERNHCVNDVARLRTKRLGTID